MVGTDGFTLESNRYDTVPLDRFFAGHRIDEESRQRLEDIGYLG